MDKALLNRFAGFALDCIHREYPNKIAHVLNADHDARPPRELTPIFYGCFDWHSAVHSHWLLVRALHLYPGGPASADIAASLDRSFTPEAAHLEVAYLRADGRAGFERPYGVAWLLQLIAELEQTEHKRAAAWREALRPLEAAIVEDIQGWLPKLVYPIRLGTHNQTAFAFGLMLDYARSVGDRRLEDALVQKSLAFHRRDRLCPIGYEPSGEDFLSPCLMVADLMRRALPQAAFANWLTDFLPDLPTDGPGDWLAPAIVLDPSDGKLVHLDGLNLSRAWALEGIASALPEGDARMGALLEASRAHAKSGLAAISEEHYSGAHWLASFGVYLLSRRGLSLDARRRLASLEV